MTPERFRDDRSDIEARAMRPSRVLQALSPELAPGSNWPDAKAGDLMFSFDDRSEELFSRATGAKVQLIVLATQYIGWEAQRGSKNPPVAVYDFAPLDAQWMNVGGRKAFIRSATGNKIEKTIFAHMLVNNFRATFAFKSTAYEVGEQLGRDADKVRVEVDGETVRVVGAFYKLSSELTPPNDRGETWWKPAFKRLAAFGEPGGPTVEQVRIARDIRFEFKTEEAARMAQLSAVKPTPALTRGSGSISITSGVERRSWADPNAPGEVIEPKPEPAKTTIDPKLNDKLDDLPWS
jgi:hypothetical protein